MLEVLETVLFSVQLDGFELPQIDFDFTTFHLAHSFKVEITPFYTL